LIGSIEKIIFDDFILLFITIVSQMSANQKRVWPELVGKDVNSALKTLKEESG